MMHELPPRGFSHFVAFGFVGLLACTTGDRAADSADLRALRDTVMKLEAAMNLAVDSLDCDTGLSAMGDREPLFVSSGYVVRTGQALRGMCEQMVAGRTGARFQIDSLTTHVLSKEAAYVVREGKYTIDLKDGTSPTVYMVMTTIWQRASDGWKMVHLHESFLPPPGLDSIPKK